MFGMASLRNNLLMKLASSIWGAPVSTLCDHLLWHFAIQQQSTAPQSGHALVSSTMRLISGTLRSTPLPWLPERSNIELPALRRKAATDKLVE